MGKQFILQSQSREHLLADLAKYLREGCTLVPGSFFTLPPAAKYEVLPIDRACLERLIHYYHAGRKLELPVRLSEGDQPAIFGAVVELTDDWEEQAARRKYAGVKLRQVCEFPANNAGDNRFRELVQDWDLYTTVVGEHDHLSPAHERRLEELLTATFNKGGITDLKELAAKHLGL